MGRVRMLMLGGLASAALAVAAAGIAASPALGRSLWTVGGSGSPCSNPPLCGDGGVASGAQVNFAEGVAVDASGNVYVADWGDSEVRKISPGGRISLFAGNGTACSTAPTCGDGGPATSAQLNLPQAVAVDRTGNVYIADTGNNEIRKVSSRGTITRVAGNGSECAAPPICGNGPATAAQLTAPGAVALDSAGNLFIADTGDNDVRKVSLKGTISRIAGNGSLCSTAPSCGDGGGGRSAGLNAPDGLAFDSTGNLYIADTGDNEVRKLSTHGLITRIAGSGSSCSGPPACGDGASAQSAQLNFPEGLALDAAGNLYIADWGDNEVRLVSRAGTITRITGNGSQCASPPNCGDGGGANSAQLNNPQGLALDAAGNLYIADTYSHEVRWVTSAPLSALRTSAGRLALDAFQATVSRGFVAFRYVLTGGVSIKLTVKPSKGGRSVVARLHGYAGFNQIKWNRRLRGKQAPHGRYQLIVTATVGRSSVSSTLSVKL